MNIKIKINCDNAAFGEGGVADASPEIARILRKLADDMVSVAYEHHLFVLRDLNGNKVGTCEVTD